MLGGVAAHLNVVAVLVFERGNFPANKRSGLIDVHLMPLVKKLYCSG